MSQSPSSLEAPDPAHLRTDGWKVDRHELSLSMGFVLEVIVATRVRPATTPPETQPEARSQPTPPKQDQEKATENQVRKIFAEMHRIGDELGVAYLKGHFGTQNPKELHKRAASDLIKWLISQPAAKG